MGGKSEFQPNRRTFRLNQKPEQISDGTRPDRICMSKFALKALAVLLLSAIQPHSAYSQTTEVNEYQLVFGGLGDRTVQVTADLAISGNILVMNEVPSRFLPGVNSWWEMVTVDRIVSADGEQIRVVSYDGDRARLDRRVGGRVEITYTVDFSFIDRKLPNSNTAVGRSFDDGLFIVGKPLFVYAKPRLKALVRVSQPDGLQITVPWDREGDFYVGESIFDLTLANVVFSKQGTGAEDIEVGRLSYGLAAFDLTEESKAIIRQVAGDVADYFVTTFPLKQDARYVQLVYGVPGPNTGGEAYASSSASSMVEAQIQSSVWRSTLAHELFHRWNSHNIKGVTRSSDLEWLKEGFTVFMAERALLSTGHMSAQQFDSIQHRHRSRLASTFETSANPPSIVRSGFNKAQNGNIVYLGGWLAASWLDRRLIEETNGEWQLERFFQTLFRDYGEDGATMSVQALLDEVAEINEGVAEEFETIIRSNDWQVVDSLTAVDSPSSQ